MQGVIPYQIRATLVEMHLQSEENLPTENTRISFGETRW